MATTSLHALPELPRSVLVTRSRENRLALLEHLARQPGPAVRLTSLGWSVVIALSPELTHEVLVEKAKSFEKSPVLRLALHPLAGQGLFTSEGELWRRQRKLMAPIFQPSQLRGFADTMSACAKRSADELADGVTDMARETTRITMAIAAKTLFDADTFDDADELGEALTVALDWTSFAATSVLALAQARLKIGVDVFQGELPPSLRAAAGKVRDRMLRPILLPTRRNAELRRALDLLEGRVARMIDERRASPAERRDLLALLLAARDDEGQAMSDRQVRDEVLTLFVAGHETTATALAWALYELSRNPTLYAAAEAEADALGRVPTYDDLPRLGLASRIFKESLRMYPPVFMFGRQAMEDLELGGMRVPKGTIVLAAPYALHHRAELYPEPQRFDPERFTPEVEAARHKTAFIPFSAGPRTCIGNHFALMEGPLVLATLLRELSFSSTGAVAIPDPAATLRPKGGVPLLVRRRGARA